MQNTKLATAKFTTALIIFIFLGLIISQAAKKFVLDELDFPAVAQATSESWLPIYYRGEARPHHMGLYHPPLYIYALAAYIKIFGFSENTVRSFGLLCTLMTAFLTVIIGIRLKKNEDHSTFIPLFLALYLLNPYTIANTTLPDIDQTILPVLISLFILNLFKNKSSNKALMGVFALLLWTKLTTPLILIPFSILYWMSAGASLRHASLRSLLVFGNGALIFITTYWAYCKISGLPFQYTFEFLAHSFTKGSNADGTRTLLGAIQQNFSHSAALVSWMTIPFMLLLVTCTTALALRPQPEIERRKTLFLIGIFSFITLFYCGLISPFGGFFKYPFPGFQFACLSIALVMAAHADRLPKSSSFLIVMFALIAGIVQTLYWNDRTDLGTLILPRNLALAALAIGVALGLALCYHKLKPVLAYTTLSIIAGLTIGCGVGISRYQAIASFPTKYYYGQQGIEETVSYLKNQMTPGEAVWSMKDVGFYVGNRYVENYDYFFDKSGEGDKKVLQLSQSGIRFFVATKGIGEDRIDYYPKMMAALNECCILVKNFGNFFIFKAKE